VNEQDLEQGVDSGVAEAQAGDAGSGGGDGGGGEIGEGFRAADRVVADGLDAEQAPVGGKAELPQGGQAGQPFGDVEVAGVVDRGFGSQCSPLFVVLLDLVVLVVNVQRRDNPIGDHPSTEPARGLAFAAVDDAPIKDQADAIRSADVEVVADDLLEKDPPRHRRIQHLGQRKLGLQDRQLIALAGGFVMGGERIGQDLEPLAQQRVDLFGTQTVADPLQPVHVVDHGEPIVERFEADTGLGGLAFGPFVAVDAQLGGVGEVGGKLDEEQAEILIEAIKVEVVDLKISR